MSKSENLENQLTVFVNTCDSYEDCWQPFFVLLKHYWPDRNCRVLLNTQFKEFLSDDSSIKSAKTGNPSRYSGKRSWSCCLKAGLERVETPYVLYLQEDYFLNAIVDNKRFLNCLQMLDKGTADYVGFYCSEPDSSMETLDETFASVPQRANYRLCTQAALWRKSTLLKYTIPGESGWQWERQGSRRAHLGSETFLCVQRKVPQIFPYTPTGVFRGQWYRPAVVDLFAKHKISIDFSRRGFYQPGWIERKIQLARSTLRRIYMKL
jgi:hypothetical protein